tara:strand:+ start:355 stop:681 length:327 start_codon:yes stop_codon:yes gene_type:complete
MPVTTEKQKPQQMDDTGKEYYGRGTAPRRAAPSAEKADDGGEAARAAQKDNVEGAARIGSRSKMQTEPRYAEQRQSKDSGRIVTPGMDNFFSTLRKKQRLSDVKPRLR